MSKKGKFLARPVQDGEFSNKLSDCTNEYFSFFCFYDSTG